ncbi:protein kinase domain-containing protein [Archangium lipolyticum]|uniref:protein kinase domain-containing protein n=1 Tax=Archangium lipolyticum TaxID=2970465 RepID=UPI00214A1E18|nr:AAA family ATPase [Archangium lipolyticum]
MDFLDRVFKLSGSLGPALEAGHENQATVTVSTLAQLIPLIAERLDGRRTVREVIRAIEPQATAEQIRDALKRLAEEGRIIEVTEGDARPTPGEALARSAGGAVLLSNDSETHTSPGGSTPGGNTAEAEPLPERLGPYKVLRRLGMGGMGVVYEAEDEARRQRVALKTMPRLTPAALYEFKKEFRSIANVAHRNVITLYELRVDGGTWFFTMERLQGQDFLHHVWGGAPPRPGEPLDPGVLERLRAALVQLAEGLSAVHTHGLLHLDIKPNNIIVEPGGRLVLLDFGVVLRYVPEERLPVGLRGTPRYLSPEQAQGRPLSAASDWYAVGVMLFEALTGTVPYDGGTLKEILRNRGQELAPRASSVNPTVPPELDDLCARLLSRNPADRPDAEEVLRLLAPAHARPAAPAEAVRLSLVGRDSHLRALEDAYQLSRKGPVYLHVRGPSGVGKSALVQSFLHGLRKRDEARVITGRCFEWESVPFKGFDAAVDELCRNIHLLPLDVQQELLDASTVETARLFPVLRSLPSLQEARATTETLEPSEQRRRAFQGLKNLLTRLSRTGPVVLFLDDVQWGDVDGARLMMELLAPPEPPPILFMTSCRSDEEARSPFLQELEALSRSQQLAFERRELEVGPLSLEDAAAFARTLGGEGMTSSRAETIAREANGHPFFVEQLVRYARDGGSREDQPLTLEQALQARVALLSEEARNILRVVAVAGRLPEQDLAVQAARVSHNGPGALAHLRSHCLIRTSGPRGNDLVEAYHDRIRESVVARLEPEVLRSVHAALAHTLEPREDINPGVLSHHFHGAGELDKARTYAVRAAEQSFESLAFDSAASHYRNALAWGGETSAQARELREKLARALFNAGRGPEAASWYLRATEGAPVQHQRELRRLAVEGYLIGGHTKEGIAILEPLLAEMGQRYPGSPAQAMLELLGRVAWMSLKGTDLQPRSPRELAPEELFAVDLCWSSGKGLATVHPMEGIVFFVRSLASALKLGDATRTGRVLGMLGASLINMGGSMGARGERFLTRAERLAEETKDPYLQGAVKVFRGMAETGQGGRWEVSRAHAEEGVRRLKERYAGVSWECALGVTTVAKVLERKGELAEMGVRVNAWMRDAIERGDLYEQAMLAYPLGLEKLAAGDPTGARELMAFHMRNWTSSYAIQHLYVMQLEVLCDLYEGRLDEAWRRYQGQKRDIERANLMRLAISRIEVLTLEGALRLMLAARNGSERANHLKESEQLARKLEQEVRADGKPHALMLRAGIAMVAGGQARAVALLDEAIASFTTVGMGQYVSYLRRRKGELTGDTALVAEADAWLARQGIREPGRWTDCHVPPLPRAS